MLIAEGYSGGALKHGPFALIEGKEGLDGATPVVAIILDDDHATHMRTAAEEVRYIYLESVVWSINVIVFISVDCWINYLSRL